MAHHPAPASHATTTQHPKPAAHGHHAPPDFLSAVGGWGMVAALIVLFALTRLGRVPIKVGGKWRLKDHHDGVLAVLFAVAWLVAGTRAFAYVMHPDVIPPHDVAQALVFKALAVGVYVVIVWVSGWKLLEALLASPGELILDKYPLAIGEVATVTYRRRLRFLKPAGDVQAHLRLYSNVHGHGREGRDTHNRRVMENEVGMLGGAAEMRGGELVARWRFMVPDPDGNLVTRLGKAVFDAFTGRHRTYEGWSFEVDLPLQGGLRVDSRFQLQIGEGSAIGIRFGA